MIALQAEEALVMESLTIDGSLKAKTSAECVHDMKIYSPTTHLPTSLIREIDSLSKDGCQEASYKFMHMINGSQGTQPMHDVYIIDSGSPFHCTGDRSLLSQYTEVPHEWYIYGASGRQMRVHGTGSIRNEKFQVEDILYVPELNQPNINKSIFSVIKLTKLGYSVQFDSESCSVIDKRERRWTWKHEIVGSARKEHGHYMLDYLIIPLNRAPVSTSDGPGLVKSLWDAALSGWSAINDRLSQRDRAQRLPV